jgi:CubicO group peptidase (beta-lactamase class C family)
MSTATRSGEAFTYGMSTDVLGAVIEEVSEMPVGEYFRIKIFEPLGMKDTYFHLPENKQQRIVTLYESQRQCHI